MYKSLVLLLFVAVAVSAMPARAQTNVFAVSSGQPANSFGAINLSSGSFSKIASIGASNIDDIAWCPTNGVLYGISNQSVLVKFNVTNGAITTVVALSQNVISLAFRPGDGALFGASATKLFTINPITGKTTPVGGYGNPTKFNKSGQNIRFAQDGNLYVSNTSTNTDIYQLNTSTGATTWMGEATGCPNVVLQNVGSVMYGVANIKSNSAELVTFNLASFVVGGTNANGSTHQITFNPAGAGTNFPANLVFSGTSTASGGGSQTVAPAPLLNCACAYVNGANQFVVSWQSVANQSYQLQCTTNLTSGIWTPAGSSLTGTGAILSVTNNMSSVPHCYFRLEL